MRDFIAGERIALREPECRDERADRGRAGKRRLAERTPRREPIRSRPARKREKSLLAGSLSARDWPDGNRGCPGDAGGNW